ncbi:centromere-associated protein E-like [Gigantopelta aegis]|uniref:centromere-associated protein E-like n=1 Tax=Gigantopelta aegis TaxID=1735272 RepID=UPI001B88AD12|nr:centromere-associated protein E-like [Gigantopelta aegis]XP_041355285.1 centromere-associated protein E-like [Gigantopelta aegis]
MNNKHKEILSIHRHFLIKNIIWTEQLGSLLRTNGVLTDSMLADIETYSSRDEKVSRLLELLPLRGAQAFEKFCDILQLSGHYFLSDFLREEDGNNEKTEATDLSKRFPFIAKSLKDVERRQLELYIAEKIQAEQTKRIWKKDTKEKDRWLDLKQVQMEETYQFEEERRTRNETLAQMENETRTAQEECFALRAELRALEGAMSQMQQKHKEDLAVQMRYNMANDNTIHKSNEKLEFLERVVRSIHHKVNERVRPVPRNKKKFNSDKVPVEFHYVMDDFEALLAEFDRLVEVERKHEKLVEDCSWILNHMGFKSDAAEALSVLKHYKQFCAQNEETMQALGEEIRKQKETIELQRTRILEEEKKESGAGVEEVIINSEGDRGEGKVDEKSEEQRKWATGMSVWQAAIMNVMRNQLQDIKLEVRKKDSRITFQEEDIKKLRAKIKQYEKKYARDKEKRREAEGDKEIEEQELLKQDSNKKENEGNSLDLVNGHTSASSSAPAANDGHKIKVLPPLRFGYVAKPSVSPSPKPLPIRHLQASMPRNFGPMTFQHDTAYPEGLSTMQERARGDFAMMYRISVPRHVKETFLCHRSRPSTASTV